MGSTKRNTDMSATEDTIKIVASEPEVEVATDDASADPKSEKKAAKKSAAHQRSRKYHLVRSQVDKTKQYDVFAAIELIKRLSYSSFNGTIEAHGVLREIETNLSVSFPHSTGKTVRVAIANEELLEKIKAGQIEFDVLLSTKEFMPKLTQFAKVLGPKGLMPNPKNGTLTENPEGKQKELAGGKVSIKCEKKAPLFHTTVGKTTMDTKELVENLQALLKACKGKILKLSISATMSPGVKVAVE